MECRRITSQVTHGSNYFFLNNGNSVDAKTNYVEGL